MKRWLKVGIIVILVIVVVIVSLFVTIYLDLAGYLATDTEKLNPTGAAIGRALVVYSPGLSGAAQGDARKIAQDLQANGYDVDLAGVRSSAAGNRVGYKIVVAGGPMYFGKVSSSIDGYLKSLISDHTSNRPRLGVFGSTGSGTYSASDFASLSQQVLADTGNGNAKIELILSGNETNDCADLVSMLLR
jgi:hypothetical protein